MNPLLIFISSLLRHVVVTGLSWVALMFSLPSGVREQVESAADFVTTSLISLLVWLLVKYGKPLLTKWGLLPLALIVMTLSLTSCTVPFVGVIESPFGTGSYSSKRGITVSADAGAIVKSLVDRKSGK